MGRWCIPPGLVAAHCVSSDPPRGGRIGGRRPVMEERWRVGDREHSSATWKEIGDAHVYLRCRITRPGESGEQSRFYPGGFPGARHRSVEVHIPLPFHNGHTGFLGREPPPSRGVVRHTTADQRKGEACDVPSQTPDAILGDLPGFQRRSQATRVWGTPHPGVHLGQPPNTSPPGVAGHGLVRRGRLGDLYRS